MFQFIILSSTSESSLEGQTQSNEAFEKMSAFFKSPAFYISVSCLIVLILLFYFLRRFVRKKSGYTIVVVRRGKIHKLINDNQPNYYLVPFVDSIGAMVSMEEREFESNKLFINDGPDRLYKIDYTLGFKVCNVEAFFKVGENINTIIEVKINDALRSFADEGNVDKLIQDYRSSEQDILNVINFSMMALGLKPLSFKINYIEPLGN